MRSLVLLAGLALLVLAAGCVSPFSQAAGTPPAMTTAPLPTTAPAQEQRLEVRVNSVQDYVPSNPAETPRPGYKLVLVDFSVTNVGYPDGYPFTPFNVSLLDPDGYDFGFSPYSESAPGYFNATTIARGETRRGTLVFEVLPRPAGTSYRILL